MPDRSAPPFDRRALLRLLAAVPAVAAGVPACGSETTPAADVGVVLFLTAEEKRSLGALANAILPPDDLPGGEGLGAVAYIDRLLTAFDVSPPAIFAGGPYSGRAPFPDEASGAATTTFPPNAFASFVPLDRYGEAAWKLTLFGSSGVEGGGPNDAVLGPIVGWQDQIRQGLAAAVASAGQPLESLSPPTLAAFYRMLDPDFKALLFDLVTQGAFAAPEYGGNTGLSGWSLCHYEGDVMPYGYSQFDPATQSYVERPGHPVSLPNPGPDPEPVTADTWTFVATIVEALGGTEFT
jgi:hypothetical protein